MSNDSFYRTLAVVDRIQEEAIAKFGNLYKFSKSCGKSKSWFYVKLNNAYGLSFKTVLTCARALDLDFCYILTGKDKKPFSELKIGIKDIFNGITKLNASLSVVKSKLKLGKASDIRIRTLFELEEFTGISLKKILDK